MQFHPNELFIYFDPETSTGKQSRAYARSISNNVNEVNFHKTKLTTTLWKEIVNMLGLRPKDLLDKSHWEYQRRIAGNAFTMSGWLEVLQRNPAMLKGPIVIYKKKAILLKKPTDILKLGGNSLTPSKIPPHLRKVV